MTTDIVLNFMKVQNRPFSVNDVVTKLHNEHGKSAIQQALDRLTSNGKISEKVYGKQKIFCVAQDTTVDSNELVRIDKDLRAHANEIESKYHEIEKEVKAQEALLASLKSSITLEDAIAEKNRLKESVDNLTNQYVDCVQSVGNEDLTEMKKKVDTELQESSREYGKRKRLCTEIIECILENYPGSKKELYEQIGIEEKIVSTLK